MEDVLDETIGQADLKKVYMYSVYWPIGAVLVVLTVLLIPLILDRESALDPQGVITACAFTGMLTIWITSNLLDARLRKENDKRWAERQALLDDIRISNEMIAEALVREDAHPRIASATPLGVFV